MGFSHSNLTKSHVAYVPFLSVVPERGGRVSMAWEHLIVPVETDTPVPRVCLHEYVNTLTHVYIYICMVWYGMAWHAMAMAM